MSAKINIVFMGNFTYPRGMAGTRRIQNVITALQEYSHVTARVLLQRQSVQDNVLCGVHRGTPYETIMGDVVRWKTLLVLPVLYSRTVAALKKAFLPDQENLLYFYGPLFADSLPVVRYARRHGYKIVFDVVEDFGLSAGVAQSLHHLVSMRLKNRISGQIKHLSDGIIAISSHLIDKSRESTGGKVPVHCMPISVDMVRFPEAPTSTGEEVRLFYAGTFGRKDGVSVLLDAFDRLAERYGNLRLVLTGRGDTEAMAEFFERLKNSPHRERIDYQGFLEEDEYYALLNRADISCMTRVDLGFAHAGFPFKLGEFLATGKPVVASRVSDVDRYLVHQKSAMLVKAGSSEEVCEAVAFLVEHPKHAAEIGARGREVATTFFDHRRQGAALLAFLESLHGVHPERREAE